MTFNSADRSDDFSLGAQLRAFIGETFLFGQDADEIGENDSLLDLGVIDSTGVLELVAFLEDTYALAVADDEIVPENLDSLAAIAAYVRRKSGIDATTVG